MNTSRRVDGIELVANTSGPPLVSVPAAAARNARRLRTHDCGRTNLGTGSADIAELQTYGALVSPNNRRWPLIGA